MPAFSVGMKLANGFKARSLRLAAHTARGDTGLSHRSLDGALSLDTCHLYFGRGVPGGWQWCVALGRQASLQSHLSQETQAGEHGDLEAEPTLFCLPPRPPPTALGDPVSNGIRVCRLQCRLGNLNCLGLNGTPESDIPLDSPGTEVWFLSPGWRTEYAAVSSGRGGKGAQVPLRPLYTHAFLSREGLCGNQFGEMLLSNLPTESPQI